MYHADCDHVRNGIKGGDNFRKFKHTMQFFSLFGLIAISAHLSLSLAQLSQLLQFTDADGNNLDQIKLTNDNIRATFYVQPDGAVDPENPLVVTLEGESLGISTCSLTFTSKDPQQVQVELDYYGFL